MATVSDSGRLFERLPVDVIPIQYRITWKPDLVKFTFSGKQTIYVVVRSPTNSIVLNSAEINVTQASYSLREDVAGAPGNISYDTPQEKLILTFNEPLEPGEGYLHLDFEGELNDQMRGFYRTRYRLPSTNEDTYAAVTQFAPVDARRAFPCWDEPAIKARFQINIIAPTKRVVIANTKASHEKVFSRDSSLKMVSFEATPPMSTYLVAFIIGEYDQIESTTNRGTIVRVWTPLGRKHHGSFALEDAVKYIEFYEDYFKVYYPLSKLDHISIPDFAFSAMENWGIVTYREIALLVDPMNSSRSTKQRVAQTIAHETAHQWFGNLVTMSWWTHLWLNEGFATFMQYLAVESVHPEFEFLKQFSTSSSMRALDLDASHKSHPIEIAVGAPGEINSIFDEISYAKGACMIRMCHNWIGDQAFRSGMKDYLTTYAYGNTETSDLWKALENASKMPVSKMMPHWTSQMGYPLVTVSIDSGSESGSSLKIKLKQEKFCVDGKLLDHETGMLWSIPISIITSKDPSEAKSYDLMSDRSMSITLDSYDPKGWFKLNPSLYGFYRVNYPKSVWQALGIAVKNKTLGPVDRLQLIDDMSALNLAGVIPVEMVLEMLENYIDEDDYVAWTGVHKCLSYLKLLIGYTDGYDNFLKFGRRLLSKAYERLGFDENANDSYSVSMMRALVTSQLINFEDENIIAMAEKRFGAYLSGQSLAPNLRQSVYSAVARSRHNNDSDSLIKLFRQTDLQEEKLRIATSIAAGCASRVDKIQETLNFALTEVRAQDSWSVIIAVSTSGLKGREGAWDFYEKNISEISRRYGSHRSSAVLIQNLCSGFASEERAQRIASFFKANAFQGLDNVIARSIEKIRVNAAWLDREKASIHRIFK